MIVKVNSANLRSGPGRSYPSISSAARGESFAVVAKTTTHDGTWYLIAIDGGANNRAWVSEQVVDVVNAATIPIASTIPPTISVQVQPSFNQSGSNQASIIVKFHQYDISETHPFAIEFFYSSNVGESVIIRFIAYKIGLEVAGIGEAECNPEKGADGNYYCSKLIRVICNGWSEIREVDYYIISSRSTAVLRKGDFKGTWICK